MRFYTHFVFGFLCAFLFTKLFDVQLIFYASVFLGILFPDIDNASSKLGRKVKPIAWILQHTVGHRGIFHSLILGLAISYAFFAINISLAIGFLIGYVSHLVLDSLTPAGIMWLFPLSVIKAKGKIRTGSFLEIIFCCLLMASLLLYLLRIL